MGRLEAGGGVRKERERQSRNRKLKLVQADGAASRC